MCVAEIRVITHVYESIEVVFEMGVDHRRKESEHHC